MQSKRDIIIKYTYKEHNLFTLHCIYMRHAILVRLIKDNHTMDVVHIIIFTNLYVQKKSVFHFQVL